MSKCAPKDDKFIYDIKALLIRNPKLESSFGKCIKVYYDADPKFSKRDYVLRAEFNFAYGWDMYDTQSLKDSLREVGATNFIGGVRRNTQIIEIAFDKKIKGGK